MGLTEYKRKRDFGTTAEPKGGKPLPKRVKGASRFVIQKHDASRLHYDFRLEMDGVLKSWAVPKGLPWKQGEKHLAVEVEDHPVEYATFEGIIPKGQYGGGTVMVWDRGNYYVYGEQPLESLRKGRLHLVLDGDKAKGEWALIRIRSDQEKNQWLLLKATSSIKPLSKKRDDQSVNTGRTMKQIAEDRDAEWESRRKESDSSARSTLKARIQAALKKKDEADHHGETSGRKIVGQGHRLAKSKDGSRGGRRIILSPPRNLTSAKPRFIKPMKAKLLKKPPLEGDWSYELKFDGIRALTVKTQTKVVLFSRNHKDLGGRFGEIVAACKAWPIGECVVDGEVVALDEKGRSSFQLLQEREMEGRKSPLYYYVFDLLQAEGKDVMQLPLEQRKALLQKLCGRVADPIRFSDEVGRDAQALLKKIKPLGLEGIVGKDRASVYQPGSRSGAWIKLKLTNEQEFVIGGYTPPRDSRKRSNLRSSTEARKSTKRPFGAVLVGYYAGRQLRFAGKVGSGFNEDSLAVLYERFQKQLRDDCPFSDLQSAQKPEWRHHIAPSEMRKCIWINPVFVCQVRFTEWTKDGKLRHPVFIGLREDKEPHEVTRE
jgi:bifunctional non-homologous end joining protein LigD